tara:strand:- start:28985 stop:31003 length:2019 start_codon:yes stop_codon:yes gene_type:complete
MTNINIYPPIETLTVGDTITVGGTTKVWDGEKWNNQSFGNHEKRLQKNRQAIEAAYKAQGYSNVFFFEDGFTYTEPNDVGIYKDGTAWTYADVNALPVTIDAGTAPSEGVYSKVNLTRDFGSVSEMILFKGLLEGELYKTGGTVWLITTDSDGAVQLSNGLYAKPKTELYAGDFGSTVNEAIGYINTLFSSRVNIKVNAGMGISDTVNLVIDCDLDMSNMYLTNDLSQKPIFEAADGWSGTATKHVVDCKNLIALRGWELTGTGYGVINIDTPTFINIGNEATQTSDTSWRGVNIKNNGSESITITNPTTINSYVKPNNVIGDFTGTNRAVFIGGYFESGDVATHITIKGFTAINMIPEEDSDAFVAEAQSTTLTNVELSVDIFDGYSYNCQKRLFKFQAQTSPYQLYVSGVRLQGDSYAHAGDSIKAVSPLDVQQGFSLIANGSLTYEGNWIYGVRNKQGSIKGNLDVISHAGDSKLIDGNTTRAIYMDSDSYTEINSISGYGQYEMLRVESGCTLNVINGINYENGGVAGLVLGDLYAGYINYKSTSNEDLSSETASLKTTGVVQIKSKSLFDLSGLAFPPRSAIRGSGSSSEVHCMDLSSIGAANATIEFEGVTTAEVIRPSNTDNSHVVRLLGNNVNVFVDSGRNPISITFQPSGATSNLISVNERIY